MPEKRTINNVPMIKLRKPGGKGFLYYADGGPGGLVLVLDMADNKRTTIKSILAWDEEDYKDEEPKNPELHIPWPGFR